MNDEVSQLEPGRVVAKGRFRLLQRLGEGKSADVFVAEEMKTSRQLVVKFLQYRWSYPGFRSIGDARA